MERHPRIGFNALRAMVKHNQELQRRYEELLTEHVEQRVAHALLRLSEQMGRQEGDCVLIDLPLPREDLAELTGTTLYTVSRILSKWAQCGFVDTGRERVLVCRPQDLARIAETPANHG
jgi:CRP-like cAMP-binding protein